MEEGIFQAGTEEWLGVGETKRRGLEQKMGQELEVEMDIQNPEIRDVVVRADRPIYRENN